jgi:hypothetical protein
MNIEPEEMNMGAKCWIDLCSLSSSDLVKTTKSNHLFVRRRKLVPGSISVGEDLPTNRRYRSNNNGYYQQHNNYWNADDNEECQWVVGAWDDGPEARRHESVRQGVGRLVLGRQVEDWKANVTTSCVAP